MATVTETLAKFPKPDFPPDELLISEDGVPLESDWHRIEIGLLVELVGQHLFGRNDYFAGGNMFIYFSEQQVRNQDFRGPDFFFVWGPSPMPLRPYWAVWKEGGQYQDVIIELLSPTTESEDRTIKKDVYERIFGTSEYYLYDPETKKLDGFHLEHDTYQPLVASEKGWLWSQQLQLWLGTWDGPYSKRDATWLRFYTPRGLVVPTIDEYAKNEVAVAQQQVAAAQQQTAAAQQQTAAERHRADAAEAELARLKAQLESKKD